MFDKFGNQFEFGEKETGFVEEATKVSDNSPQLLIVGYDPDGENQVMVASNMKREVKEAAVVADLEKARLYFAPYAAAWIESKE